MKSITSLLLIVLMIGAYGCKLNETPYSTVASNDFYKNQDQAQVALNGVYARFWWGVVNEDNIYLNENPTGILQAYQNPNDFDNFSWTPSDGNLQDVWSVGYDAINRANTLLDNLQNSKIPSSAKNNIAGQAKFLRALVYFKMVTLWGGVPLYKHATTSLKNVNKPRTSADSIYAFIESDLNSAIDDLSPYSESDHQQGKVTSGAAMALLAKVYAQQQKWPEAAAECKKVMDLNEFGLMPDYHNVFNPADNNNKEMIFSIQHLQGGHTSAKRNSFPFSFGPADQSTSKGEVHFYNVGRGYVYWQADTTYFNNTPDTYRKSQTMRETMPYYYASGSSNLVNQQVTLNRPFVVKYYYLDKNSGNLETNMGTPIIRYSDVLLTYAESLNEANNGPTPAAYDAINKVRARARGEGTSHAQPQSTYPPLSGLSQSAFRDSVLAEEAREFEGEGHRRLDLLRHDRFISDAKKRGVSAAQDYRKLYPIPSEEINRNSNLKQNSGY
ncbi:MAG TPA: RagB/SusD family nutrient uptake outer membrane protein [Balneolaceae bacterium]|nr:RagB/SusD family nutrient uptake outer membrane protein [Balneolaceae bacterium]